MVQHISIKYIYIYIFDEYYKKYKKQYRFYFIDIYSIFHYLNSYKISLQKLVYNYIQKHNVSCQPVGKI